jgi:hypothetical protein
MQLRVARLCLDCEELHTDNTCPRCASESYAFLSNWLQVEERRRRWRRPAGQGSDGENQGIGKSIGRWIRGGKSDSAESGPLTRASDHVPNLDFDGAKEHKPAARTRLNQALSKNRVR